MKSKNIFYFFLNTCLFLLGITIFAISFSGDNFNVILSGIMIVFLSGMIATIYDFKHKYILFFFYICIFTFLLSRPFISMCKGNVWWAYSFEANKKTLLILFISLVFLRLGEFIASFLLNRVKHKNKKGKIEHDNRLSQSSLLIYIVLIIVNIIYGVISLGSASSTYADMYISSSVSSFSLLRTLASLAIFPLCIYLATNPKKRNAVICLILYIISTIPNLIIGTRGDFVLAIVFTLIYFIYRHLYTPSEKWIGKFEIWLIVICVPLGLFALGALNYIRDNQATSFNLFDGIVDFFYKQGVSYDIMTYAMKFEGEIHATNSANFVFGSIIDTIEHGTIGTLLGGASLGGNTVIHATEAHSFAHTLAYTVIKDEYLTGHGLGSSFMLEAYFDCGLFGVGLISLVYGAFLRGATNLLNKSNFLRVIALIILSKVMLAPRSEALGAIVFLFTVQFWFTVLVIYLFRSVYVKKKVYKIKEIRYE